ncbi:hypothetical protein IFR04_014167 [Cadophora malorum]|uniref:Uncharacterized protein n=1 Tax=Cadophora malorum TaxID=108018 RepID=A0A8H7T3U6_9HELO|nr:hypothetical protein IFR04_014167 [Cadophora malorum]
MKNPKFAPSRQNCTIASLLLAFFKLLVLTRPQDWTEFKVAARLIYSANLDADALCYVMLAARPLWVALLALSTITSHTQPPNASTAPYCLWALVRAHMTLLLLLSKCDFRPDFISLLPTEVLTQIFGNLSRTCHRSPNPVFQEATTVLFSPVVALHEDDWEQSRFGEAG